MNYHYNKQHHFYHMVYLKTYDLLLASIFNNIRSMCLSYYQLDPANHMSNPSLSIDAMLLMTDVHLDLITNLDIIRETITKAESVVQNLMADISMITMGKIPPHLLPPDVLIEGLEAISEVLPAGNTLLSPTTSGVIWDYYHLTMVKFNDGIRLFIELPIVTPQSSFDLFDIIPFPTQIPETKNFTLMQTKVPLLALSKDHYSYIPLTHNDLISCSPTSSPLCVKSFPVWSTAGAPSCELYVVLNDVTGISEKCDLVLINSKKERLVHIQERVWAY